MQPGLPPLERYITAGGVRIYRLPVVAFPGLEAYAHLVLGAGVPTLVDTGSGLGSSNDDLDAAFAALHSAYGERISLGDVARVLITHGHIDHFGGLSHVVAQAKAGVQIGVHPLDRRILSAYDERVIIATKELTIYLERAGIPPHLRARLIEMYGFAKRHYRSHHVDLLLDDGQELDGMRFIHTPGHCSGQVCIRIDDVLLSADHILARTTPHQSPESITHYTGLGHYFASLDRIAAERDLRLALGGHEEAIEDVYARIQAIRESHGRKLNRVIDALRAAGEPQTISALSKAIYPERHGYDVLLAIEEVGAHVEYLYERGELGIANLDQIEQEDNPALLYQLAP